MIPTSLPSRPEGIYLNQDSATSAKYGERLRGRKHDLSGREYPSCYICLNKKKPARFSLYSIFKSKTVAFLALVLLHLVAQTSSLPPHQPILSIIGKSEHLVGKRETTLKIQSLNELSSNDVNINKGSESSESVNTVNGGITAKRNKRGENRRKPSFEQLVILAQEEARCLQKFGGRTFSTSFTPTEGVYSPILCSKYSNHFAQCEICRNLTSRTRSRRECSLFCGTDTFCSDLCLSINKAVSETVATNSQVSQISTNYSENNNQLKTHENPAFPLQNQNQINNPIFAQRPQVFCEGVLEDPSSSRRQQLSTEVEERERQKSGQWESGTEITNHFIVLKWNLHLQNSTGQSSGESSSTVTKQRDNSSGGPIVFVLEKYSESSKRWEALGKTLFNLQQVNVTFLSDTYKWRVTAVGTNGILDSVTSTDYKTLNGYVKPGPPREIYVVKTVPVESNSSIVKVLIGWDPPEENACSYKIVLETHEGAEKPIRIKEPLGVHHHWFNLLAGTQYSILITTRDPSWDQHSESNLTRLDFRTPTCLASYNYRFDKCAPPPPRGIESKILENSRDSKTVRVALEWKPPQNTSQQNPILYYNVTVTRLTYKNGGVSGLTGLMSTSGSSSSSSSSSSLKNPLTLNGSSFPDLNFSGAAFSKFLPSASTSSMRRLNSNSTTVLGNITHLQVPSLEANAEYSIMVQAISIRGSSSPAQHHLVTKIVKEAPPIVSPLSNWLYLAIPVCGMMFILFACNMGRIYFHKRQVKIARNQYFQSMEERDSALSDFTIVPLTDETTYTWKLFDDNFPKEKWQIGSEHLVMGEVIGQGAFGVVRRAKISRRKLQAATLKYLDKSSSPYPNGDDERGSNDLDMETVAVKMLKVSATREDREQLVKEIMTMQSLGFHPQIVGLIGACTKGRSLSLVLEYCSGGDLLTFIRKVRAKYWPTLGLSEAKKNSTSTSSTSRGGTTGSAASGCSSIGMNRIKNNLNSSTDPNHESEDNSPINYADLEHFSDDYSSSTKSELRGETQPLSPNAHSSCHSPSGKSSHQSRENGQNEEEDEEFCPIDEKDVLSYARQISLGMEYLEKNRIVHRDLACRNCLLMGDHKQVKLSDFGLSRDIYTWNVYHQKSNGKLPIKWMAIESIFTHVFTAKSDVWSYGILLWELVTMGGTPYPGLGNTELFHLLKSGYRMERPDNCSEELYALMKKCWRTSPSSRPSFAELRNYVENMMEAAEPNLYLSLMADIPSDHFRLGSGSRSDLLQMNEPTTDGGLDLVNGSSASTMNSKKYAGYHNTHTTYTTPTPRNCESSTSTASNSSSGKSNSVKFNLGAVPERGSKSVVKSGHVLRDGESSSKIQSPKISNLQGEEVCGLGGNTESSLNKPPTLAPRPDCFVAKVAKLDLNKDVNDDDEQIRKSSFEFDGGSRRRGSTSSCSLLPRSPTTPVATKSPISLQFPYPFRHVNSMTIIENKAYGLTDD